MWWPRRRKLVWTVPTMMLTIWKEFLNFHEHIIILNSLTSISWRGYIFGRFSSLSQVITSFDHYCTTKTAVSIHRFLYYFCWGCLWFLMVGYFLRIFLYLIPRHRNSSWSAYLFRYCSRGIFKLQCYLWIQHH